MTTALTTKQKNDVMSLLTRNAKAIKSVIPKHLTFEKMARMAYHCIEVNPTLARCSQSSLFNAILEASSLGLEIGGPLSLSHLIPYGDKATLIIDYKGFIQLAANSNVLITYEPVYNKDTFKYSKGLNPVLEHIPFDGEDRGELTHAYAIASYPDGRKDFEVIDKTIAMTAKSRSAAKVKKDSPWNNTVDGKRVDEWMMWCKTAVRRLAKRVPKNPELQRAAIIDEKADAGIAQDFSHVVDVEFEDIKDTSASELTDKIKEQSKSEKSDGYGDWLKKISDQKAAIEKKDGNAAAYYQCLGVHGVEKANECREIKGLKEIHEALCNYIGDK